MRRCIVYLCVFLALTACSPKSISGERAVRTSSTIERVDSSSLKSWLEKAVRETMNQHLRKDVGFESVTVVETLSAPDSSGSQHVTSKATTRSKGRSVITSGAEVVRDESIAEKKDSSSTSSVTGEAFIEDKSKMSGNVSGWMPWYVYLAGLVGALLVGLVLAVRGNKWSKMKLK